MNVGKIIDMIDSLTANYTSSVESQKGLITIQRCYIENQKGAPAVCKVQGIWEYANSASLVLKGPPLNTVKALTPFWFSADDM